MAKAHMANHKKTILKAHSIPKVLLLCEKAIQV